MATCKNCGCEIGKLENPVAWNGHRVCLACNRRLGEQVGYSDGSFGFRMFVLLLSGAMLAMGMTKQLPVVCWLANIGFLIWIILVIAAVIQKANWKARH